MVERGETEYQASLRYLRTEFILPDDYGAVIESRAERNGTLRTELRELSRPAGAEHRLHLPPSPSVFVEGASYGFDEPLLDGGFTPLVSACERYSRAALEAQHEEFIASRSFGAFEGLRAVAERIMDREGAYGYVM